MPRVLARARINNQSSTRSLLPLRITGRRSNDNLSTMRATSPVAALVPCEPPRPAWRVLIRIRSNLRDVKRPDRAQPFAASIRTQL